MIKREHIKQAIDAISRRDPEIGYTLDEMLAMGLIDTLPPAEASEHNGDFYLLFDNIPVTIKRFIFFQEGTVPIEQRLLIKYGELVTRQKLLEKRRDISLQDAAGELRIAGVRLMVIHEIDYAITRLQKDEIKPEFAFNSNGDRDRSAVSTPNPSESKRRIIARLETIKRDTLPLEITSSTINDQINPAVFYRSMVDLDTPACFVSFPFCMDALLQVADINLEFFQVRFLIDCLIRGTGQNLFACVVDNKIEGLVYLALKERYFYKTLEISYIATVRGAAADRSAYRPKVFKGIGTFLVAGVWLLWKTVPAGTRDILLDSEIGARRFYDGIGFHSQGLSKYRLKTPKGHLLKAVIDMASQCRNLNENVITEIKAIIKNQVKILCRKAGSKKKKAARITALEVVKTCLSSEAFPEFAAMAVRELTINREKIPESPELFQFARKSGSDETKSMLHLGEDGKTGKNRK